MMCRFLVGLTFVTLIFASGCQCWYGDRMYVDEDCSVSLSGRYGDSAGCSSCGGCSSCEGAPQADCHDCKTHSAGSQLFRAITCVGGCGEFYCDEWLNDPPSRKCDDCGQFTGHQPPRPRFWRFGWLMGGRHHESNCSCSSCAGGQPDIEFIDAHVSPEMATPEMAEEIPPGNQ